MLTLPPATAFAQPQADAETAQSDPSATSAAASAQADPKELAKAKYRDGVIAFKEERFADAAAAFIEADELVPSPALSFNIARAYDGLGNTVQSLYWYMDYLRRNPSSADRETVKQRIAEREAELAATGKQLVSVRSEPSDAHLSIDGTPIGNTPWWGELPPGVHVLQLEHPDGRGTEAELDVKLDFATDVTLRLDKRLPAAPTPAPPPPAPVSPEQSPSPPPQAAPTADDHFSVGPWKWVTLGVGAAALAASGGFEAARRSAESDAEDARTQLDKVAALDRMDSDQRLARILLGVGGGLVVAGAVLWVLDDGENPAVEVALGCGGWGCDANVRGSF